jgi:hypothetical protein
LSNVDENERLNGRIYSDLAIAHAQDKDPKNAKVNEKNARDYMVMARDAIQSDALLDDHEGMAYLYLAENHSNRSYALLSRDLFEKSIRATTSKGYLVQVLIRKANVARLLGDMKECVTCLTKGYELTSTADKLTQINDVLHRIPESWQREMAITDLRGEVSRALEMARG